MRGRAGRTDRLSPARHSLDLRMTSRDERAEWTARWQAAAPRLAEIRVAELRRVDLARFIESMNDALAAAQASAPAREISGLVIQQRLFARLRS